MKVSIIGAGSWGTAIANLLSNNGHEVLIYDIEKKVIDEITFSHTNNTKLPGSKINLFVKGTTNLEETLNFSEIIILSVPTKVTRIILENIKKTIKKPKMFVNTSKGLEPDTGKRVSEIVIEMLGDFVKGFVALTGPSHAEEVILGLPTVVTCASTSLNDSLLIQSIFSNGESFRVYTTDDLIGAELGGALKNIYAIAAGMLSGLGYGDNARAALITRALVEMNRLAIAMGAKPKTLAGLSGVGDLIVTTTSLHSRNFQAGLKLATGRDLQEAVSSIPMVVEGARTTLSAYQMSKKLQVETPIIDAIYSIIYDKQDVKLTINMLMNRALKSEFE